MIILTEVKKIGARRHLMPSFRANMTAWLYEYAKKHMSKHSRMYISYQMNVGSECINNRSTENDKNEWCRPFILLRTKGRRAEVMKYCLEQPHDGHRCLAGH